MENQDLHYNTLLQAVAQIAGIAIDLGRLYQGYETSIEILKSKGN